MVSRLSPEARAFARFADELGYLDDGSIVPSSNLMQRVTLSNDDELWEWVYEHFGVAIPRVAVCTKRGHAAPFAAFADAYFARYPRTVWKASRGMGGKTVLLALLAATEAATLGAGVSLLGGSGEQSERVHNYMGGIDTTLPFTFWMHEKAPRDLLLSDPTKRNTRLSNGGWIRAHAASQKSVRGGHPQRLRGDEIDEMDPAVWDAAQGQPQEAGGIREQTVGSSTHQHANGTMTREMKEAAQRGWPIYEWCYRETHVEHGGFVTDGMIERKRASITTAMWETEYEGQEPAPEGRAIVTEKVREMFREDLGHVPGAEQTQPVIFEVPEWEQDAEWEPYTDACFDVIEIDGGARTERVLTAEGKKVRQAQRAVRESATYARVRYAQGTDWGKRRDHSVSIVLRVDCFPWRYVAWLNNTREPYPIMFERVNGLTDRYFADATHDRIGLGDVADDFVREGVRGVVMQGKLRKRTFSEYIVTIEKGHIVAPLIESHRRDLTFVTADDLYAPSGHPPDSFFAGALAVLAADEPTIVV